MIILLSLCALFPENYSLSKHQKKNICRYENSIREEANKNKIEPELLASVIFVESGFHTKAVSPANACGLTQVIPKWTGGRETSKKEYTCEQLKDPKTSIRVAAEILGYAIHNYANKNIQKGLCFYSTGSICLKKKGYYKRSRYVEKVMQVYRTITSGC